MGARADDDRRLTSVFWLTTVRMLPFYAGGLHALLYLVDVPGWRDLTLGVGGFLRGFPAVSGSSDALASRLAVDPRHAAALLVAGSALFLVARAAYSWSRPKVDDEGLCWPQGRQRAIEIASRLRGLAVRAPTNTAILGLLLAIVLWAGGVPRLSALILVALGLAGVALAFRRWRAEGFDEASAWNPYHGAFWAPLLAVSFVLAIVAFLWIPARIEDGAFTVSLGAKSNNAEVLWAESGNVLAQRRRCGEARPASPPLGGRPRAPRAGDLEFGRRGVALRAARGAWRFRVAAGWRRARRERGVLRRAGHGGTP